VTDARAAMRRWIGCGSDATSARKIGTMPIGSTIENMDGKHTEKNESPPDMRGR
jgi:hypothetical protein